MNRRYFLELSAGLPLVGRSLLGASSVYEARGSEQPLTAWGEYIEVTDELSLLGPADTFTAAMFREPSGEWIDFQENTVAGVTTTWINGVETPNYTGPRPPCWYKPDELTAESECPFARLTSGKSQQSE